MILPFVWMAASSLKPLDEIYGSGLQLLPEHPTLSAYETIFAPPFDAARALWNSFYMATLSTVLSVFLCALGGYAFAKFEFPGRRLLFNLMLATMALPFVVILVPMFMMMRNTFDWIDTPWPLIIPLAANAFGIFFMRQYMLSLPDAMLDAARVDGSSELGTFWRIVVPTITPALVTLGIISFVGHWNGFMWANAVLRSPDMQTLPVLLNRLETARQFGGPPFDLLMAGSVVSLVPMLILYIVFQRQLREGLTAGSVKG
jgi:ABC-type glycerol-3-phosphate transport system permease component